MFVPTPRCRLLTRMSAFRLVELVRPTRLADGVIPADGVDSRRCSAWYAAKNGPFPEAEREERQPSEPVPE